ncbi:MAG: kinase/pyrophosphorylase, partial [Anaerolineales bacterium]|nr:kinase/pyrophosphorylase [Anaerolineales bacterium]
MYYIFAVSDATGTTSERVLRAALSQFDASQITVARYGGVRTVQQVREVVHEAELKNGFVVHTFVSEALRRVVLKEGREHNVTTIDL